VENWKVDELTPHGYRLFFTISPLIAGITDTMLDDLPGFPKHLLDPITDSDDDDITVAPPSYSEAATTPAQPFSTRASIANTSLDALSLLLTGGRVCRRHVQKFQRWLQKRIRQRS
jgi:hypothetical protein